MKHVLDTRSRQEYSLYLELTDDRASTSIVLLEYIYVVKQDRLRYLKNGWSSIGVLRTRFASRLIWPCVLNFEQTKQG